MLRRCRSRALRPAATAVALLLVIELATVARLAGPGAHARRVLPPAPAPALVPASAVELEGDPAAAMAISATPSGQGYWLVDADGRVAGRGDAVALGSAGPRLTGPIVGMAPTPSGRGYWLVASDGGIFSFGDAVFHGSTGAIRLNRPIVGMAPTPSGQGYWLVASDGGIFSFGDAVFMGSTGALAIRAPVAGMTASPTGDGYWLVTTDGGVFSFGAARFAGSASGQDGYGPAVGMASSRDGGGYWLVAGDGQVSAFGDAPDVGGDVSPPPATRPVGARDLDAADPGRATPARGGAPGHPGRDLPTLVYYPATAGGGGTPPARGPWPLVVFAHGYDQVPPDYAALLQQWASAGYVVAAPYLPGARSDMPGTATEDDLAQEPADLSTVISAVVQAAGAPGSWLSGLVDAARIAVAGHSDGAVAVAGMTLDSAYHDGRVRAALVLSGAQLDLPGGAYGSTGNVPLLVAQGSADPVNSPDNGYQLFAGARAPRVYVDAVGGGHQQPYVGTDPQAATVRAATVDFLDAYLRDTRPALARLAHDADTPGRTEPIFDL